ncbi:hypothetical protein GWI33_006853 [Rhynchophorus ferrugineus]|uniref:Uncharacterized protein n=1 Tax=Rhynchophorus ferrugineus TaxID=354439 RepID=A0A834IJQ2_RHYFE|nr:hypothetical protein GWI33_006853 [Rhynchophorus ferrugineus]
MLGNHLVRSVMRTRATSVGGTVVRRSARGYWETIRTSGIVPVAGLHRNCFLTICCNLQRENTGCEPIKFGLGILKKKMAEENGRMDYFAVRQQKS